MPFQSCMSSPHSESTCQCMYVCVCMYIYIYVCMYAYMYVHRNRFRQFQNQDFLCTNWSKRDLDSFRNEIFVISAPKWYGFWVVFSTGIFYTLKSKEMRVLESERKTHQITWNSWFWNQDYHKIVDDQNTGKVVVNIITGQFSFN